VGKGGKKRLMGHSRKVSFEAKGMNAAESLLLPSER